MIAHTNHLYSDISKGKHDPHFSSLYGIDAISLQKDRYLRLLELIEKEKPNSEVIFVSAPGRTELAGNHTDHNHGCVLAAAVDLDCVGALTPTQDMEIILHSEEYPSPIHVDLQDLTPQTEERGKPEALVRGVAASFHKLTGKLCGFYGRVNSTCQPGTGLSSSAAFSVLVGATLNVFCHDNVLSAESLAIMAQQAENDFFGKPCGLMDQMASSVGKTTFIDFHQPDEPRIRQIETSLQDSGYQLAIIDTGGSHIGLTPEYASIPDEMKAASAVLQKPYARDISLEEFLPNVKKIRAEVGDRATLRLLHFIEENVRARVMADHLRQRDFNQYLKCVEDSGLSSLALLQNCASATSSKEQGILMALAMSKRICNRAISRVHGGGFAGTIQSYVPLEDYAQYENNMEQIFGSGSVKPVLTGRPGVVCIGDK